MDFWASDTNTAIYKYVMPGGAKIFDKFTTLEGSSVVGSPTWDRYLGGTGICEMFTRKIDAFFKQARPEHGATCTLSHGDLRGDNIFFCNSSTSYPEGWLCIDFQLMFRGPVPSDLAYLMSSGSVLPEVYAGANRDKILRAFYDRFKAKTKIYKDYNYGQFEREYAMMTTVLFVYFVGMGAAYWQGAAFRNELPDESNSAARAPPRQTSHLRNCVSACGGASRWRIFARTSKPSISTAISRACRIIWQVSVPGWSCRTI